MISIDALGLSNRTRHLLSREQILTVEELVSSRANGKLASLRGMGPGTLHEIDEALASFSPVIDLKNQVSFERFVREEFKKITIKAKLELETGRLSDKVICDNACLDQCFVNDIDTTPFQSILDLKPIFDCALKSEDIHQELQDLLVDQSKREINVLLGRFGPNKRTLEDLAHNLNVTRERVRQIELGAEAKVVLAYQRNWLPRTQTAINIAKAYGNRFRYETWKNKLEGINLIGSKKLIINNERIDSIDTLRIMISIVRLLGRRNLNELFSLPDNFIEYVEKPSYSAQAMLDIKKISKKEKREIRRVVNICGAIYQNNPLVEVEMQASLRREKLELLGYKEIGKGWYSQKVQPINGGFPRSHVLFNTVLRILSVTPTIIVRDLEQGIDNAFSRFHGRVHSSDDYVLPPMEIIRLVLVLNGFVYTNDTISWPKDNPIILEGRDKIFVSLVDELGPIVTFQEICDAFETSGLTRASAIATMQFSPLVQKLSTALYKLCGQAVSPVDYKAAEQRRQTIRTNSEYEYTMEGEIIFRTTVGSMGMGGVVSVYGLPNLTGTWKCCCLGRYLGDILANDTFLWRLGPVFGELGVRIRDRVELRFNVWERTVYVTNLKDPING